MLLCTRVLGKALKLISDCGLGSKQLCYYGLQVV